MTKRIHIQLLIISILTALTILFGGCSSSTLPSPAVPGNTAAENGLQVHFIDVGQGDSILAESNGHFMLIDAGENDQADTVIRYLKQAGVTSLDYVIGTHPHSDHIGGLDKVIDEFTIGKIILPPVEHTSRTFEDVLNTISNKGLKITRPVPGDSYSLGDASFTVVAPVKEYGNDLNNWSVGIRLAYGSNSFLMCGDAESKAEADMIGSGEVLSADVLKAGHHGSSTSTSDAFLKKVSPSYVVIQCGKDNSYGHPHRETMEKLEKAGCQVFRTDEDGTVVASSDGTGITWSLSSGQTPEEGRGTAGSQRQKGGKVQDDGKAPDNGKVTDDAQADHPAPDDSFPSQTYILNTNTKKFHLPGCSSASQIQEKNRREVTEDRAQLLEEGYVPCKQCNP